VLGLKKVTYVNTVYHVRGGEKYNIRKALNSTNMYGILKDLYVNVFKLESHEQLIGREFMAQNEFLLRAFPISRMTIYNWLKFLEKEGKIKLLYKKTHCCRHIVFLEG